MPTKDELLLYAMLEIKGLLDTLDIDSETSDHTAAKHYRELREFLGES